MSDLPTKADFLAHGRIACPVPDEDPDCAICREQFTSVPSTPSDATESNPMFLTDGATDKDTGSHVRMQMPCCNNVFCHHCITTWLDFVNTCPTCRVQLFEGPKPEPEPSESTESETSNFEEEYYEDLDILMEFDTDD